LRNEERRLEKLEKSLAAEERKLELELERERIKIDAEKRKADHLQRDLDATRIKADIKSKSKEEDYQVFLINLIFFVYFQYLIHTF
jgi:hypothetical protein